MAHLKVLDSNVVVTLHEQPAVKDEPAWTLYSVGMETKPDIEEDGWSINWRTGRNVGVGLTIDQAAREYVREMRATAAHLTKPDCPDREHPAVRALVESLELSDLPDPPAPLAAYGWGQSDPYPEPRVTYFTSHGFDISSTVYTWNRHWLFVYGYADRDNKLDIYLDEIAPDYDFVKPPVQVWYVNPARCPANPTSLTAREWLAWKDSLKPADYTNQRSQYPVWYTD